MNGNSDKLQRSSGEIVLFALAFVGFVIAIVGVITSVAPLAFSGLFLVMLAMSYFMLKGWFLR